MFDYASFIDKVWFLRRDIVSDGFDRALEHIARMLPGLNIHRYPTGMEAWTWIVPEKWEVKAAHIKANGKTLLDVRDHPLHVMSYSEPVSGKISHEELMAHLHTYPKLPDAIPYEFSYYERKWGFCVQHNRLDQFDAPTYDVLIDAQRTPGELKVGELYLPGSTSEEIVLMAHLCHPAMVNDDLSGVSVLVALAQRLQQKSEHRYGYRLLFLPETIGSIAYLSQNEALVSRMRFGVFVEMVGNDAPLSLQHSKQVVTSMDKAAELCLQSRGKDFRVGTFGEIINNDEKTFNGPGINIPTISLSRANFWGRGEWPYPEYHSSADTPAIVAVERLREAEEVLYDTLAMLDHDYYPKSLVKGPIFLSRYGLWVDWRVDRDLNRKQAAVLSLLWEGKKSLIDIAHEFNLPFAVVQTWLDKFVAQGLVERRTKPVSD